jgi:Domain of unknown function (DUF4224)
MTEYLPPLELHLLTGYVRASGQAQWLREKAIPHRRDGRRLIVSRIHVRAWLEERSNVVSTGINWASIK